MIYKVCKDNYKYLTISYYKDIVMDYMFTETKINSDYNFFGYDNYLYTSN